MSKIKIPYSFKKVDIGKTDKTKRIAVERHEGKLAIVEDFHEKPTCLVGILRHNGGNYLLKPVESSTKCLAYQDLTMLLVEFP